MINTYRFTEKKHTVFAVTVNFLKTVKNPGLNQNTDTVLQCLPPKCKKPRHFIKQNLHVSTVTSYIDHLYPVARSALDFNLNTVILEIFFNKNPSIKTSNSFPDKSINWDIHHPKSPFLPTLLFS